ncbi:MAG: hypothetical protein KDD62_02360, partial [Bdellovibrionales bacterium]|nr:hypothetical protein [Bdellovibrionales bacterium]
VKNYEQAQTANQDRFNLFFTLCLDRGIYFAQSPYEAGFVSAVHGQVEFDKTIDALQKVFQEL